MFETGVLFYRLCVVSVAENVKQTFKSSMIGIYSPKFGTVKSTQLWDRSGRKAASSGNASLIVNFSTVVFCDRLSIGRLCLLVTAADITWGSAGINKCADSRGTISFIMTTCSLLAENIIHVSVHGLAFSIILLLCLRFIIICCC